MIKDRPVNKVLLIEAAKRERKGYRVYKEFRPNPRAVAVTPKFYSKHEGYDFSRVREDYLDIILDYELRIPKEKYPLPITESHRYGWYREPLIDNKDDFRLNFPIRESPDIKLAVEMKMMASRMR